jgi:hypothetical protein
MIGTQPNCRCPSNTTWNPRFRECVPIRGERSRCPGGMLGTPPDCYCPSGMRWSNRQQRCVDRREY